MKLLDTPSIWFATSSQHLYGPEALKKVAGHSQKITAGLDASSHLPLPLSFKPVMTTPDEIRTLCRAAENDPTCAGLVLWMHTFSPSKMWIGGLTGFRKPLLHLHTQYHRDLPWGEIDMDFMNLHQAAHGDREAGFLHARLRLPRKVVVGYWEDSEVQERIGAWMRSARAWHDLQGARIARFGDTMRQVAVTDGDKVGAEIRFGVSVNGYGIGDLAALIKEVSDASIDALPKLPVARAVWKCLPDFKTACASWIHAGGAHHTGFSYSVTSEMLRDFAEIVGIEIVVIDSETRLQEFRNELRWNETSYHINGGIRD